MSDYNIMAEWLRSNTIVKELERNKNDVQHEVMETLTWSIKFQDIALSLADGETTISRIRTKWNVIE